MHVIYHMVSEGRTEWRVVAIAALQHFLVDALCVCCLYMLAATRPLADLLYLFILYNVLAFLTQPLTGYVVDRLKHKHWMLLASMLSLTLATMITIVFGLCSNFSPPFREGLGEGLLLPFSVCLGVCLLGLGNSLFHVWGGQQVAVQTQNDMRSLGIFVSTGAFGLAVGGVFASWPLLFGLLIGYCFLGIRSLEVQECRIADNSSESNHSTAGVSSLLLLFSIILLFVVFRSMFSTSFTVGFGQTDMMVLLLGFLAMSGKAAGGFLCRWFGMWWAVALMLVGTAGVYFLAPLTTRYTLLLGLFLINCTMPVTLYLANVLLKGHEGLSFGLLAAALIPGYLMATDSLTTHYSPLTTHYLLLITLVGTILIELGVLWFLRERRQKVLWSSVVINVLTNVPLNLLILQWGVIDDMPALLLAEAFIVLVEAVWYFCFVRSWRQAFIYSLLCNAISFLTGLLVQLLYSFVEFYY